MAVLLPRGVDMVVALLAVLKAGGSLRAVGGRTCRWSVRVHVVGGAVRGCWWWRLRRVRIRWRRGRSRTGSGSSGSTRRVRRPRRPRGPCRRCSGAACLCDLHVGVDGCAEGCRGQPSSVVGERLRGCWDAVPGADAGEAPVVLMHAPHAFDASTCEMWMPLLRGGRVVVAGRAPVGHRRVRRVIRGRGVNDGAVHCRCLFNAMVEEALEDLGGLRLMWTGGDVVSGAAVERLLDRHPEMLAAATCRADGDDGDLQLAAAAVSYGRRAGGRSAGSMDNTRVYVLDDRLSPVPVGCRRGAVRRRAQAGPRLCGPPGPDGRAVRRRPVRTARRPDVPDRRPGAVERRG